VDQSAGRLSGHEPHPERSQPVHVACSNDVALPADCSVKVAKQSWWDNPSKLAILVATGFIVASGSVTGAVWSTGRGFFHTGLHAPFWSLIASYPMVMYGAPAWRVMLWRRYKPMESVSDEALPSVTVVIPAYNEGALVRQSILSAARSNYPKDKLQ